MDKHECEYCGYGISEDKQGWGLLKVCLLIILALSGTVVAVVALVKQWGGV